jgi:hypothetical protein
MLFGKSFLISILFRYVLPKGVEWLEDFTEEKKEEIRVFVRETVPGELYDERAVRLVEMAMDAVIGMAKVILWKNADKSLDSQVAIGVASLEGIAKAEAQV